MCHKHNIFCYIKTVTRVRMLSSSADTSHGTQGQCRPSHLLVHRTENFVQMIIYKHMKSAALAEYINMQPLLLPCSLMLSTLTSLPFFSYCCSLFPELAKSIHYTRSVWPPLIETCSVFVVTIKTKSIPNVWKRTDSSSSDVEISCLAQHALESEI